MSAALLLLLADALSMLDACIVSGGRLDYMCIQCGGDDGALGGDTNVKHRDGCAYVQLKARVNNVLTGA